MKESTVFMVGDKESGQLMLKRPRVSDGFLGKVFFFFFFFFRKRKDLLLAESKENIRDVSQSTVSPNSNIGEVLEFLNLIYF